MLETRDCRTEQRRGHRPVRAGRGIVILERPWVGEWASLCELARTEFVL